MAHSKTIELFLINGDFNSPVTAELDNWNGKAIKVSRDDIGIDRPELQEVGVYFLFCADETEGVYIGESENIQTRLKQHVADYNNGKESFYWTQAVAFVGKNLDKAKIRYLENKFVVDANNAKRYKILTKASSAKVPLKESSVAEMDEFSDKVKLLISALGFKIFKANIIKEEKEEQSRLYLINSKETEAKMLITDEGFVLLTGSRIIMPAKKSCPKHIVAKRNDLLEKGIVDASGVTTKDIVFGSPSAAAAFVEGIAVNGNYAWKDESGAELTTKPI